MSRGWQLYGSTHPFISYISSLEKTKVLEGAICATHPQIWDSVRFVTLSFTKHPCCSQDPHRAQVGSLILHPVPTVTQPLQYSRELSNVCYGKISPLGQCEISAIKHSGGNRHQWSFNIKLNHRFSFTWNWHQILNLQNVEKCGDFGKHSIGQYTQNPYKLSTSNMYM